MKTKLLISLLGLFCFATLHGCNDSISFPTGVNGVAILESGGGNVFPPPPITHSPLAGAIITISQNGQTIAKQTADAEGGFRIDVGPGSYVLTGEAPPGSQFVLAPPEQNIVVTNDRLTQVVVTFSQISHF